MKTTQPQKLSRNIRHFFFCDLHSKADMMVQTGRKYEATGGKKRQKSQSNFAKNKLEDVETSSSDEAS